MEKSGSEKVLVVESDDVLRRSIADVLRDAGYEVSTDAHDGMKYVLTFSPDAVILAQTLRNWIAAIFYRKSRDLSEPKTCA